jgi:hypothetical protein
VIVIETSGFPVRAAKFKQFCQMMMNRLTVGAFRHQSGKDEFGDPVKDYLKRLKETIRYYEGTGNLEYLVDAANYCALEFYNSLHPEAHFKCLDSRGSSVKEGD